MRAHNPAVDGVDHDMCGGLREEVDPMATDLAYSHATQKMACGIGAAWKEPSSTLQVYLEELAGMLFGVCVQ